jgi:Uma2 family endonuclease
MSTLPKTPVTEEQYLEIERAAELKSEYFDGQMYARSGAREGHNLISGNVFSALRHQTRPRGCRVFMNDMRVRVSSWMYTYPHVVVAWDRKFLDCRRDTLLNPTLICEVLSASTERYDRGRKFRNYQSIESLRQYVLVSTDQMSVEVFTRQADDSWVFRSAENHTDTVELESIGCKLTVAEIYDDVEFDAEATA